MMNIWGVQLSTNYGSATGDDHRMNPRRGGDCIGSAETTNGEGEMSIVYDGTSFEGLAKEGNTGKGTRHKTVGKPGECEEAGVPRGVIPDSNEMDNDSGKIIRVEGSTEG